MSSQAAAVLEHEPEVCAEQAREETLSPEYLEFLRRHVEAARADIAAGRLIPHEEVEAYFAARRAGMPRTSRW